MYEKVLTYFEVTRYEVFITVFTHEFLDKTSFIIFLETLQIGVVWSITLSLFLVLTISCVFFFFFFQIETYLTLKPIKTMRN